MLHVTALFVVIVDHRRIGGAMQDLCIFQLQTFKLLLCFPDPRLIRCKEQVHFFKCALLRLRVESPDHWDGEEIDAAVDEEGILRDGCRE